VRHAADVLGIAFSQACNLKLIPFNPAAAIRKPKAPKRQMLFLTPEQVKILLEPRRASRATRWSSWRWGPAAGRASCSRSPGTT
jgi:hypothetical protein